LLQNSDYGEIQDFVDIVQTGNCIIYQKHTKYFI